MSGDHPNQQLDDLSKPVDDVAVEHPIETEENGASGEAAATPTPRFGLWIILNMATVLCCAAWPTGIPGFVIALLAQSDWAGGDRAGAQRKYRLAVVLGSLSLIWGGLVAVSLLTLFIFTSAIPGTTEPLAPPSY
jgi:hypothetical protein